MADQTHKKKKLVLIAAVIIIVFFSVLILIVSNGRTSSRSEQFVDRFHEQTNHLLGSADRTVIEQFVGPADFADSDGLWYYYVRDDGSRACLLVKLENGLYSKTQIMVAK